MNDRLTISDIARMADVSPATVSRVINGKLGARSKIKQRVLKVLEETGFRPNAVAQTLARQRSGFIGLIFPNTILTVLSQPYYTRSIEAVSIACNKYDYSPVLFLTQLPSKEDKNFARIERLDMLDGIIANVGCSNGDLLIPLIKEIKIPVVLAGRREGLDSYSFVDIDNVRGAYNAVQHLMSLGRKRIATITGPLSNVTDSRDRLEGYKQALAARGFTIDEALIAEGDYSERAGYHATKRLIPQNIDAIFAANDEMAIGAIRAIQEEGLSVPKDIAIVGFDDIDSSSSINPTLTTIRQPLRTFGLKLIELLSDQIEHPGKTQRKIILETELIIRQSCGETMREIT
jgi:LacI family transcriptional regulator